MRKAERKEKRKIKKKKREKSKLRNSVEQTENQVLRGQSGRTVKLKELT